MSTQEKLRTEVAWAAHRTWCAVESCTPDQLDPFDFAIADAAIAAMNGDATATPTPRTPESADERGA